MAKTFFLTFGNEDLGETYESLKLANTVAKDLEQTLGESVLVWAKEGHQTELVTQGKDAPEAKETFFLTVGEEDLGEVYNTLSSAYEACVAFGEALSKEVSIWSKKGFLSQLVELGPDF